MIQADNQSLPIAALAVVFTSGAIIAWLVGNQDVAPYIGIAIAIAGISISIQQFYIRSMVSTVVSVERRDFYRGSSFALLCIGSSIVFLGIARIIAEIETESANKELIYYVLTCSTLGGICLVFSGPLFWNLMFAFTIVSESNSSKQIDSANEETYNNSNESNELVDLRRSGNWIKRFVDDNMLLSKFFASSAYSSESRLLYYLNLFYWIVSLATAAVLIWHFVGTIIPLSENVPLDIHYLDAPITFPHTHSTLAYSVLANIAMLWLALTILVSALYAFALAVRLLILSSTGSAFSGMIFMMGFSCLFMVPVLFHTCLSLLLYLSELSISLAATMSAAIIIIVLWLCLGVGNYARGSILDKLYSWLYKVVFKDARTITDSAYRWKANLDSQLPLNKETSTPIYIFGFLLLVLAGVIATFHSDLYNQPWIRHNLAGFYSFAFLALGCAGITAIDLRSASNAFQSVVDNYLNNEVQATLAHEVLNNLRPVGELIHGEPLQRILRSDGIQDDDSTRVTNLLAASTQGLSAVDSMIRNLQARRKTIANINQSGDVVQTVKNIVDLYKQSLLPATSSQSISITFAGGVGRINARWNQQGLYQSLRILLDNAVQATAAGRPNQITVSVQAALEGGRWGARISVQDSGTGMVPEVAKRFGQPQASTKDRGSSRGIGLSLAAAFCKQMDGQLRLEHTVSAGDNTGTEVRILLASATKNY